MHIEYSNEYVILKGTPSPASIPGIFSSTRFWNQFFWSEGSKSHKSDPEKYISNLLSPIFGTKEYEIFKL